MWTGIAAQNRLNEQQVRARLAEMKNDDERKFFLNHVYCYGMFRCCFVLPRGSTIWHICFLEMVCCENFTPSKNIFRVCPDNELRRFLSPVFFLAIFFDDFSSKKKTGGLCNELQDDSKFTNHSRTPNMCTATRLKELGIAVLPLPDGRAPDDETDCFAARDIEENEEITDDYGQYENPEYYVALCKEYNVEWAGRVAELYE